MPVRTPITFGRQAYRARSAWANAEELDNLYVEQVPGDAKAPSVIYGSPGLSAWSTVGDGPIRGMIGMGADLFVVSGDELYAVDSIKTATLVGTVGSTGAVRMIENGSHVGIATNGPAYAANSSSIVTLAESNLNGAAYQDGIGLFTQQGTEKFWVTDTDDMTTIGALAFSSADTYADSVVGVISNHRRMQIFGETTIETWINTGDPVFPFARDPSGFIERGCYAGDSIAKAKGATFFLGDDLSVYALVGVDAQQISTPGIDYLISQRSSHQTARGFVHKIDAHTFYVLSFSDLTLVYDIDTGLWSTRSSYEKGRWRANCYARHFGLDLVGDFETGAIYEISPTTYDEDGETIVRTMTSPPIHANGRRVTIDSLEVECEVGVGLVSGQGSDPQIMLDWTDDAGHSWSNQLTRSLGAIGERKTRVIFNRLGSFDKQRSFRLSISDPVKVAIMSVNAQMGAGT